MSQAHHLKHQFSLHMDRDEIIEGVQNIGLGPYGCRLGLKNIDLQINLKTQLLIYYSPHIPSIKKREKQLGYLKVWLIMFKFPFTAFSFSSGQCFFKVLGNSTFICKGATNLVFIYWKVKRLSCCYFLGMSQSLIYYNL